jgi:hypothetical protein
MMKFRKLICESIDILEGWGVLNEDAMDDAIKEISGLVDAGAGVDTKHERERLVDIIAQKHGISPVELSRHVKISKTGKATDQVILNAWNLLLDRLPSNIKEVVQDLEIRIEDVNEDEPFLEAETFPATGRTKGFIIYREAFRKARVSEIIRWMAHEVWHVYSDWTDFYENLGKVFDKKIKEWKKYGVRDAEEFVNFLRMLEEGGIAADFQRRLKQKIIDIKGWGETYFLEQGEEDRLKGVLKQLKSKIFVGAIDELMAESLAKIVSGRSMYVPAFMANFILRV